MQVEIDGVLSRFHRVARRSCSVLALDANVEVARARSIVAGAVVDAADLAHLYAYVASRQRFFESSMRSPESPSYWSSVEYFQLDHASVLDRFIRSCACELACECDSRVLRKVVCAFLHIAWRTHSIRRFVQHDMYRFSPSDPASVDVTRRLVSKLLDLLDATETCQSCARVIAPPPDAA